MFVGFVKSIPLEIEEAAAIDGANAVQTFFRVVFPAMRPINIVIVVITIIGLQLGGLISGAVVTERIFGLPGFGKLTLDSVFTRDYPVIQAVVVVVTAAYIVINLAVDILYSLINPRIRVGGNA